MVGAWHGHGIASANQTRPHCVNQTGKTQSTCILLAARHGRGTAWARNAMCESAFTHISKSADVTTLLQNTDYPPTTRKHFCLKMCRKEERSYQCYIPAITLLSSIISSYGLFHSHVSMTHISLVTGSLKL
jgi:hypothetical protein